MAVEDVVYARLAELIAEGQTLRVGNEYGASKSLAHSEKCKGWIPAAVNVVHLAIPCVTAPYRVAADKIASVSWGYSANEGVGQMTELLNNLVKDARGGLLASVANQARAEVFDDFLDHAKACVKEGQADRAGVIAGVVFEDALRRVCRNNDIQEKDVNLDPLISALVAMGKLSPTKAKRARAAAHVRTKATHAQWDEFDIADVRATIEFTEELIRNELDA